MTCSLLACGLAQAAGFGELTLHSRIGEKLRAEVPVSLAEHESVESRCFTLASPNGNELPAITRATLSLNRKAGGKAQLLIESNQRIDEPLLALGVRLGCGIDLQRDYILMPEAAPVRAEMMATAPTAPGDRNTEAVARTSERAPAADTPGQALRPAKQSAPPQPKARPTPRPRPAAPGGDRLMIGTGPSEGVPPNPELLRLGEMENRMLRMESSLHTLNDEVEQLRMAVELGAQAMAVRHELKLAQSLESTALAPPAAGPQRQDSGGKWLELILSTLAGGGISILLINRFSRRKPGLRRSA